MKNTLTLILSALTFQSLSGMEERQLQANKECPICFEDVGQTLWHETSCCNRFICRQCVDKICLHHTNSKNCGCCPYCREHTLKPTIITAKKQNEEKSIAIFDRNQTINLAILNGNFFLLQRVIEQDQNI